MPRKAARISTRWINETREAFREFLDETNFPDPERLGERGPSFKYPAWLIMFMSKPKHKKIYRERAYKVEPMQGLVKDIFELYRCWMRGDANNRWLFAAMGLTIQMHQLQALKQGRSTWNIKEQALG